MYCSPSTASEHVVEAQNSKPVRSQKLKLSGLDHFSTVDNRDQAFGKARIYYSIFQRHSEIRRPEFC